MPEGPDLYLAAQLVNTQCRNRLFGGRVSKSQVSWNNPDVNWKNGDYFVSACSRGKELKLTLTAKKSDKTSLDVLIHFGMTGCLRFVPVKDKHKHAHLNFFTKDGKMVLSFVDSRRFGKWHLQSSWSNDRGPCALQEYTAFRKNVLANVNASVFDRPICEAIVNQKYFNGIGIYLRAEILYRAGIPPFTKARSVLDELAIKKKGPDLLRMCYLVSNEVIRLGKGYCVERSKERTAFDDWLQCYNQPGMSSMIDSNKRTIWFHGKAGTMGSGRPASRAKSPKRKKQPAKKSIKAEPVASEEHLKVHAKRIKVEKVSPLKKIKVEPPEKKYGRDTRRRSERLRAKRYFNKTH